MPCPFAKFSSVFGKPNEGLHKYRVLKGSVGIDKEGLAIVDLGLTILLSLGICKLLKVDFVSIPSLLIFVNLMLI